MERLVMQLQGATVWDEFANVTPGIATRVCKKLIRKVIRQAIEDLKYEVEQGYDVTSEARYYHEYWSYPKETPRPNKNPKENIQNAGRKVVPVLSPHAFIFGTSKDEWSFLWCCDQIGLSPTYLRKGVSKNILVVSKKTA